MQNITTPPDADWRVDGLYYKIGLRGCLFYDAGLGWTRSALSKPPAGAVAITARAATAKKKTGKVNKHYHGPACVKCGSTVRLNSNRSCVFCQSADARNCADATSEQREKVRKAWEVRRGFA